MDQKLLIAALPVSILMLMPYAAKAGQTINEAGALVQVVDKWNETEPDKGHKLVEYAGRCVSIPDDPKAPKVTCDCVGKYEYMPDKSWKGAGTCTDTYQGGDTTSFTWEENSDLKEYPYKITGGTGRYKGASGNGTYTYENLTDTLQAGRYKATIQLP